MLSPLQKYVGPQGTKKEVHCNRKKDQLLSFDGLFGLERKKDQLLSFDGLFGLERKKDQLLRLYGFDSYNSTQRCIIILC